MDRAAEAAQKLITLNDSMFWTHGLLSHVYLWQKRPKEALRAAEHAVARAPHDAQSHMYVGDILNYTGRAAEAIAMLEQVSCQDTFMTASALCFSVLGDAYYATRRYEDAIVTYSQALSYTPQLLQGLFSHLGLAASYSEMGRQADAQTALAAVLKINPRFSLAGVRQRWPYKDPAVLERFVAALHKAGLK